MDEARLKALYRRHTQTQATALDECAAADIDATLSRHGWPAEEQGPLDRVAGSAQAADIARLVAALGPDIDALAGDLRQARSPRRAAVQRFVRRGFALAAGVGTFAVLFALVQNTPGVRGHAADAVAGDDEVIMSVSFEAADRGQLSAAPRHEEAIFKGNFDS